MIISWSSADLFHLALFFPQSIRVINLENRQVSRGDHGERDWLQEEEEQLPGVRSPVDIGVRSVYLHVLILPPVNLAVGETYPSSLILQNALGY